MLRLGWVFDWQSVERDALVIEDERGVMLAEELYGDVDNRTYRVVAFRWPESEDQ